MSYFIRNGYSGNKAMLTSYAKNTNGDYVYLSFFAREKATIRGIGSSLMLYKRGDNSLVDSRGGNDVELGGIFLADGHSYSIWYSSISMGKDNFIHAVCYPKFLADGDCFFSDPLDTDRYYEDLYNKLMAKYDLPLLFEWINLLDEVLKERSLLTQRPIEVIEDCDLSLRGKSYCFFNELTQETLDDIVAELVRDYGLLGPSGGTNLDSIKSIDDFYITFGTEVLNAVSKDIVPLVKEPKGKVENIILKNKILFPPQAYVTNGAISAVKEHNLAYLIEEMGCGKSLQAAALMESAMVDKYMKRNPGSSKEEAILKVAYRNIIMCPGHLLEKWQGEIINEIPYSSVTIIKDFSQIVALSKEGMKRTGKHYYIISKDFAKLSFQYRPLPTKVKRKGKLGYVCSSCFASSDYTFDCKCGGKVEKTYSSELIEGLVCPSCNEILIDKTNGASLSADSFSVMRDKNSTCAHCGEALWAPLVDNLGTGEVADAAGPWMRASVYSNASKKGRKTLWIHKDHNIYDGRYEEYGFEVSRLIKSRKVSPIFYMKRQLKKGFFDFACFDEAHQYSSGGSAQGHGMHIVSKLAKNTIALTGTISNGYVTNIFYLLWRLQPWDMVNNGWDYHHSMDFIDRYGTVERKYEQNQGWSSRNTGSKGRTIGAPKVKPGVSPLIYTDYLFKYAVFLNISDLSAFMPPYIESVVGVDMEPDVEVAYNQVINTFKDVISDRNGGKKLMADYFQSGLSYPDKPYGLAPLLHPSTGLPVIEFEDFSHLLQGNSLLNKEKHLVELVKEELKEGRNAFVFCEFTNKGDKEIVSRIKSILERHLHLEGKVAILSSSSPRADKREAYIHTQAKAGIKVFITNPRNVETGLDFIFKKDGKVYNYPTLIFYQLGTSLYTLWQASRRAYRLTQDTECRTYYFCYAGTMQQTIVELMGKKKMATSILQGKFSSDALCTNSGVDVRYALMQALERSIDKSALKTADSVFKSMNNSKVELSEDDLMFLKELENKRSEVMALNHVADYEVLSAFDDMLDDFVEFENPSMPAMEEVKDRVSFDIFDIEITGTENASSSSQKEGFVIVEDKGLLNKKSKKSAIEGQFCLDLLSIFS